MRRSLFEVVEGDVESVHGDYLKLRTSPYHSGTRCLIDDTWRMLPNPDPHFWTEFRGSGFDARIWELYIYRVLIESGYTVEQPTGGLDFHAIDSESRFALEATVARPSNDESSPPWDSILHSFAERQAFWGLKLAHRIEAKRRRRYAKSGRNDEAPIVLAVAPFFGPESHMNSGAMMLEVLYGVGYDLRQSGRRLSDVRTVETPMIRRGKKEIAAGLFNRPNMYDISAVVFNNCGTVAKFHRMATFADGTDGCRLFHAGYCHDHTPESSTPSRFVIEVERGDSHELWGSGCNIYHNPNARIALPRPLFDGASDYLLRHDRQIDSLMPDFHPYLGRTVVLPDLKPGERVNADLIWMMAMMPTVGGMGR
jgi:hypothetical protein